MNEKMKKLLDYHLNRMGIEDRETAEYNLLNVFMPTVLEMESSGDYQAVNIPQKGKEATTAKGGFQFVEGSVVPALNRLERRIGKQDWGTDLRKHKDASKLTPEQQQLLFMGDLLEKKGSDQYMKKVMQGDKQGSMDAYYKLHHTAPDAATKKRAEEIFGNVYSEPQAMNQSTELEQLNEVLSYQVALGRGMKQTMAGFGLYEDKNKGRA